MRRNLLAAMIAAALMPVGAHALTYINQAAFCYLDGVRNASYSGLVVSDDMARYAISGSETRTYTINLPEGRQIDDWVLLKSNDAVSYHAIYLNATQIGGLTYYGAKSIAVWSFAKRPLVYISGGDLPYSDQWYYLCPALSWLSYNLVYHTNFDHVTTYTENYIYTNDVTMASSESLAPTTNETFWVRTGWDLTGWAFTADSTNAQFLAGAAYTNAGAQVGATTNGLVNLYAVWEKRKMTIALDAEGGSVYPTSTVAYIDEEYDIPSPLRKNYDFAGWFTQDGSNIVNGAKVQRDDIDTLYARWSEHAKYTASFVYHDKSGKVATNKVTVYSGAMATPPGEDVVGSWPGHRFTGWDGEYINIESDVTIEAEYEDISNTISFDPSGAQGFMEDMVVLWGVSTNLNANTFRKDGTDKYVFAGWDTNSIAATVVYTDCAALADDIIFNNHCDRVVLYAVWKEQDLGPISGIADASILLQTDGGWVESTNTYYIATQEVEGVAEWYYGYTDSKDSESYASITNIGGATSPQNAYASNLNENIVYDRSSDSIWKRIEEELHDGEITNITTNVVWSFRYKEEDKEKVEEVSGWKWQDGIITNIVWHKFLSGDGWYYECGDGYNSDDDKEDVNPTNTTYATIHANYEVWPGVSTIWSSREEITTNITPHVVGTNVTWNCIYKSYEDPDGEWLTNSIDGAAWDLPDGIITNLVWYYKEPETVNVTVTNTITNVVAGASSLSAYFEKSDEASRDVEYCVTGAVYGAGTLTFAWRTTHRFYELTESGNMFIYEMNMIDESGNVFNSTTNLSIGSNFVHVTNTVARASISSQTARTLIVWRAHLVNIAKDATVWLDNIQWTPAEEQTYRVEFNANGGDGEMDAVDLPLDERAYLPWNQFTKTGAKFLGWTTSKDGVDAEFVDHAPTINLDDLQASAFSTNTLYAVWQDNKYLAYFDAGDGVDDLATNLVYGASLTAPTPVLPGYTYEWDPTVPSTMPAEDVVFKAVWTKIAQGDAGGVDEDSGDDSGSDDSGASGGTGGDDDSGGGTGGDIIESDSLLFPSGVSSIGEFTAAAAAVYNGWLRDSAGRIRALLQVKTGKASSAGKSTVSIKVTPLTGKTVTKKGSVSVGGNPTDAYGITYGNFGLYGTLSGFDTSMDGLCIEAAKDVSKSKVAQEKSRVSLMPTGAWSIAFSTSAGEMALASVAVSAKGKAKVTVVLASGKKKSITSQGVLGESSFAVSVLKANSGVGFVMWIDASGNATVDSVAAASGWTALDCGKLETLANGTYSLDFTMPTWRDYIDYVDGWSATPLDGGAPFTVSGAKWTMPRKVGAIKYNAKTGTLQLNVASGKTPANLCNAKIKYTPKTGLAKGSFKLYYLSGSKLKQDNVSFSGMIVNGTLRANASVKKLGTFALSAK